MYMFMTSREVISIIMNNARWLRKTVGEIDSWIRHDRLIINVIAPQCAVYICVHAHYVSFVVTSPSDKSPAEDLRIILKASLVEQPVLRARR